MLNFIINVWDRVANNWKTSGVAILAAAVIVAQWFGYEISSQQLMTVIIGVQAIVLLFAKD